MSSVKKIESLCPYVSAWPCVHAHVSAACNPSQWKAEAHRWYRCISLKPSWTTGNSRFDHYLPVSLSSAGTTCYDCWCAAPTHMHKHTCKLQHIRGGKKVTLLWIWLVPSYQLIPEEVYPWWSTVWAKRRFVFLYIWTQLAVRPAGVHSHIHANGQFGPRSKWLFVARGRKQAQSDEKEENICRNRESKANKLLQIHFFDLTCCSTVEIMSDTCWVKLSSWITSLKSYYRASGWIWNEMSAFLHLTSDSVRTGFPATQS